MTKGAPPPVGLALLGRFELSGPGGVVDLASNKLAGLLTYLACTAPRPQPRERLSALLWGSYFEAQAKQNLRQSLYRLRKALGEDVLQSDGEVVSLNQAIVLCDVSRFGTLIREGSRDALSAAVDLYRGRLVDDVAISEEGWKEWLDGERERFLELALGALMGLGEQELAAGRAEHALKAAQRAISLNNLREDAHRLIVRALAAAGRKAEAHKHYKDLVALLKRELNTEPDAATNSLVAELGGTQPQSRLPAVSEIAKSALAQPGELPIAVLPPPTMSRGPEDDVNVEKPRARSDATSPAVEARCPSPERRQLTIMVCTMVSSTPLSADLDPEEMSERIALFHKVVADVAARFGGLIAQYLGDGVHVYFGYPEAHEHDAEQAVRAGLALLDAVGTLRTSSGLTFRARAGIATGLVVVGEPLGTGNTRQRTAIGDAPNLAARLQIVAAPGEVVIAASTRRLVGGMFDCHALAADELKGLPPSMEAWRVRNENVGVSRFEARRTGTLSPLVGRQEEMELLLRRWYQAKAGEGRVVLLSGEPGIGKSRLAESLLARLEGQPHARMRYFCSPHHTQSPLYPFIAQLDRTAGLAPGSSAVAKLDKLEALLKPTAGNVAQDLALIAELLFVPTDGRYPPVEVSPQQKREMTLGALLHQLEGIAAQSRVVIVFEDIHWIDPTSLDLLDRTVARLPELPVLLIATFRPEFQPAWVGQPHVTMLPLSRLSRRDSAGLIRGITKGRALPDAVVEQVLARTDGVPFFIEELTNSLLERGVLRETADGYTLDGPLPALDIPTTLQASLTARLDRLGPVKGVAQIGAAIGREFSHELIGAMVSLSPAELDAALEDLTASGLVSRRGTPPLATYAFKHALVHDAAYATLLRGRRRQLHANIAMVLVERFSALAADQPEIVARHFTEAGSASEAMEYWVKAGRLACARWANREAVKFFEQALHLLEPLPETRERLQLGIDLRFDLKTALLPLGAFERIIVYLHQAEGLATTLADERRLCQAFVHLCQIVGLAGYLTDAIAFGQNALPIAESLGDVPLQVTGTLYLGAACLWTGQYRRAEDLFVKVLRLLEGQPTQERFGLSGYPAVIARFYTIWFLADQGRFEEGIVIGDEALHLAETLNDPYSLAHVCWYLGYLYATRGELDQAIRVLERGLEVARQGNQTYVIVLLNGMLGYAITLQGRMADAIPLLERELRALERMGHRSGQTNFLIFLAEACMLADRLNDAEGFLKRARALAREGGQRGREARAIYLLGDAALHRGSVEEAGGYFRDALALAEEIGMHPLIAHCHVGLGKLYRRRVDAQRAEKHFTAAATLYRDLDMPFWLERAEAARRQPAILSRLKSRS